MTQATAEGTTFSWLTGLLAETNEKVSDEEFKKFLAHTKHVENGEQVSEVPKEIANLLVYTNQLTREMEKTARRHAAEHIASFGEDDEDHSPDQCARIRADESFVGHKVNMLKSLFWVAIWEHLERPSKNFCVRRREDTLVVVEIKREELGLEDLPRLVVGTLEGGLDLLSRLFR